MTDKLTKEALADQRKRLKIRLWRERAIPVRRVLDSILCQPRCVWCKHALWSKDDCIMHEWLIKRSDLPVKLQHLIMTEENCVLADHSCHERYGQTREFKLRAARAQYRRYGRETIVAWVESLGLKQHIVIPTEEDCRG